MPRVSRENTDRGPIVARRGAPGNPAPPEIVGPRGRKVLQNPVEATPRNGIARLQTGAIMTDLLQSTFLDHRSLGPLSVPT